MPVSDAPPSAPPERKLPFKRTVKRKPIATPDNSSKTEPDGIELFRRSGTLFDKFQQQASATKEQRRKAQTADEDAAADSEIQAQLLGESKIASSKARRDSIDRDSKKKRQCIALSDDEDEPGTRPSTQRSPRKPPNASIDRSPSKFREPTRRTTSTPTRTRSTQPSKTRANVIVLDEDSDDDDYKPPQSRAAAKEEMRNDMVTREVSVAQQESPRADDSDSDPDSDLMPVDTDDSQGDQLAAKLIQEIRERMAKEHASRGSPAPQEAVEIYIESRLEGSTDMRVKVNLLTKMSLVKKSWVAYNHQRKMPISESVLNEMFFTWRGNKLYDFTTLASLDIKRSDSGQLYSSREAKREGFDGWDKVHIEVWTPELFDEYLREKDRERMRQLGELVDEEPEREPTPEPQEKVASIKVILKSKDNGTQNLTVPINVEVAKLSLAFRTMKKIPAHQDIVLRFDGEDLEDDSTIDEAGIEDMDSIEVHIK